ncbi:hypothetical protein Q4Q39_00540 [Flavivirga amylovorans]|uniref:SdiA-regulated family protein n=1 Tax=Flavivirga amylovorans TaxID=870486 RepID=A0ABT8WW25_9FLAO|nr:hypothetical protein [Flavivirga amylovorans]MDO5985878.1 hypothetical protein [Flavivirga amylovorans]
MNKFLLLVILLTVSCNPESQNVIADLPKTLHEVSGTEIVSNSDVIWMLNDSGNASKIYGLNRKGKIKKELKIDAKNHDWEDLTADKAGNLYIGDFGNNVNERKNLCVLKVNATDLKSSKKIDIERISFTYSNQKKFPPKKKKLYFDCEAFFHYNDSLYLFTKSRVKNDFGKTHLYKIPAKKGNHIAELISTFSFCDDLHCWITSADISDDGKQMVLLTQKSFLVFTDFTSDDFFNGTFKQYDFKNESQKESICFKDRNTVYITDEKAHGGGGNLYEFKLE